MTAFTEADIRAGANDQSFQRGSSYQRSSAVHDIVRRGNLLTARVQGSEYAPYEIAVSLLDDGSIDDATCTCPYDWGGYCKHIVAVLLTVLQGDEITVKPELDTLLAGLTEAQLRRIIRAVAEDQPAFAAAIEQEVEWLKTHTGRGHRLDDAGRPRDRLRPCRHPPRDRQGYSAGWSDGRRQRLLRALLGR